ncbi:MAG: class I SAM-dependent methyltransferase [Sporomusaceae bacterium]|nr:class I SAM-dependent methyltransferase [Sporomusaceae bacterium]
MTQYDSGIFNCKSLQAAKEIILTAENGVPTEKRWAEETAWLLQLLCRHFTKPKGLVLDFGCGVGRMSNPLVALGHSVVGVDASENMRRFANEEVMGEAFTAISPAMLDQLLDAGLQFDLALSVWVLQHCYDLIGDAGKIIRALKPGGGLFIVDMNHRAVPTNAGWVNDGKNVFSHLSQELELVAKYRFDLAGAPANLRQHAWIGYFTKP